jgi:hypothetical protein
MTHEADYFKINDEELPELYDDYPAEYHRIAAVKNSAARDKDAAEAHQALCVDELRDVEQQGKEHVEYVRAEVELEIRRESTDERLREGTVAAMILTDPRVKAAKAKAHAELREARAKLHEARVRTTEAKYLANVTETDMWAWTHRKACMEKKAEFIQQGLTAQPRWNRRPKHERRAAHPVGGEDA